MSKRGYGNVKPRFAKYFARKKNSAGPHSTPRRPDVFDAIEEYEAEELEELKKRSERKEDCPVCGQFTRLNVHNIIIGYVCSVECLVDYWEGRGHE